MSVLLAPCLAFWVFCHSCALHLLPRMSYADLFLVVHCDHVIYLLSPLRAMGCTNRTDISSLVFCQSTAFGVGREKNMQPIRFEVWSRSVEHRLTITATANPLLTSEPWICSQLWPVTGAWTVGSCTAGSILRTNGNRHPCLSCGEMDGCLSARLFIQQCLGIDSFVRGHPPLTCQCLGLNCCLGACVLSWPDFMSPAGSLWWFLYSKECNSFSPCQRPQLLCHMTTGACKPPTHAHPPSPGRSCPQVFLCCAECCGSGTTTLGKLPGPSIGCQHHAMRSPKMLPPQTSPSGLGSGSWKVADTNLRDQCAVTVLVKGPLVCRQLSSFPFRVFRPGSRLPPCCFGPFPGSTSRLNDLGLDRANGGKFCVKLAGGPSCPGVSQWTLQVQAYGPLTYRGRRAVPQMSPSEQNLSPLPVPYLWGMKSGPMAGQRIGEAKVPGPAGGPQQDIRDFFPAVRPIDAQAGLQLSPTGESHLFRFAVANPTAILNKASECCQIASDVLLLAETSAVDKVQGIMGRQFRQRGYTVVWGDPVAPHTTARDSPMSLRGHAAGVAILGSGEVHHPVPRMPSHMLATTRLAEAMARFGPIEIRVLAIYGWPRNHANHRDLNQELLMLALQRVRTSGVPTVLGGDLNMDVTTLPVWEQFSDMGYVEAFQFAQSRLGVALPPTCKGSTRHDTFLLPALLQPLLCRAEVLADAHLFDAHAPLVLTFALPHAYPARLQWNLPKSSTIRKGLLSAPPTVPVHLCFVWQFPAAKLYRTWTQPFSFGQRKMSRPSALP